MARIDDENVQDADSAEGTNTAETENAPTETEQGDAGTEGNTEGTDNTASTDGTAEAEAAAKAAAEAAEKELQAAFESAVASALTHEGVDTSTGELPTIAVGLVTDAYGNLSGAKAKRVAKDYLQAGMEQAMLNAQYLSARGYLQLSKQIAEGTKRETVVKTPVDPTEAHVNLVAALMLAPNLVPVPEGVDKEWVNKAQALFKSLSDDAKKYRTWLAAKAANADEAGDAPTVSDVVLVAAKLATGRTSTARKATTGPAKDKPAKTGESSGVRRNIATHIAQAFADKAVGTFLTIAEIANFKSDEYGDEAPSQGAIAARLFPNSGKCTLDALEPDIRTLEAGGKARKGAVKLAA